MPNSARSARQRPVNPIFNERSVLMKLVTFSLSGSMPAIGIVVDGGIVQIAKHIADAPADMLGLIAAWPGFRIRLQQLEANTRADVALDAVTLLAPVPRPPKML